MELELISKKKLRPLYKEEYFYYGTMKSQLLSDKKPKEILLLYKNEKSKIYNDHPFVYDISFWDRFKWDIKGSREDKIYVAFEDPNIDWNEIKMIEKDPGEIF